MLAAIGSGDHAVEEIPDLIEHDTTFTPNREHRKLYDERYQVFLRLYRRNKSIFARFNSTQVWGVGSVS